VRSLGARRPETAARVQLVLAGWCAVERSLVAFEMHPIMGPELVTFQVARLDLSSPHFAGDRVDSARILCAQTIEADEPGASATRAPLNVLRQLINDPDATTIGGDVQIGFTVGTAFQRVRTARPIPGQEPRSAFWLNAICTDDLPPVGPCGIGLMGTVSP
jgi:hypothetical protein